MSAVWREAVLELLTGGIRVNNDYVSASNPVHTAAVRAAASGAVTRPADTTQYASGDLVANSTTAGSVTPIQFTVTRVAAGSVAVRRVRLRKSGTSTTNASFRLHLYGVAPTVTNGDNGAWLTTQAASYIGSVDVTCDRAFSDGAFGSATITNDLNLKLASGRIIYGLTEARAAYTPADSEVLTWELEVIQD